MSGSDPGAGHTQGRASGQGRVYQATGDQYVTENHYHQTPPDLSSSLFGPSMQRTVVRAQVGRALDRPAPDSVRTPLVGRAPRILRDRADLMGRLTEAVRQEGGGIHVLHGMGGCGKTAVAQTLFNKLSGRDDRIGLWVNASERATLRAGMLAVAADRGAETSELAAAHDGRRASADLVWHYLNYSAQPWLLVLDNADDPSALEEGAWLRSSPQGTVVVTTRVGGSRVWGGAELHPVGVLPLQDAALVLHDLAPAAGTPYEAETVARRLECLPLALTLAGSFLSRQLLENWSMSDYRRHLDENPTELIDRGAEPGSSEGNARQLVGRTWEISLGTLADDGIPECEALLRLLSCLSSDPVPLSLLRPLSVGAVDLGAVEPPLPGDRVEIALRGLLDHSMVALVAVEESGEVVRCVKTHGVLLDSVAAAVPSDQRPLLVHGAARLMEAEIPAEAGGGAAGRRVRRLVPHVLNLLRLVDGRDTATDVVRIANSLSRHVFESGDYQACLHVAQTALSVAEMYLEADHPLALSAGHDAALALFRVGRFEESEALHRKVLDGRERVYGEEHPETLQSFLSLHEPLGQLGRVEESVAALKRAQEIRCRALGENHPDTLFARALLIEYLAIADEVEQFDRVGPETVALCEEILGDDALATVTSRHNYAFGLYRLGRYEQAEPVARRALSDRQRFHGAEHPLVLSATILLSWILAERGALEESISFARVAVSGQERSLGPEHPYLLTNRTGLAVSLAAYGQKAEAQELARLNLPLCERVLGTDSPVTAKIRGLLVAPE
ncbi:tetratricopeptide repeat protein [Streptomyces sp. ADI93-02]|uniref:tetratricopeptide repeat protein n=1 Tax=Streptomyces sp. ADI93-02 TaxID=1522757 RepID=UPI000F558CD0|nr:tetratricopeptide repeat protein [Streptomyces sp. ADI93-02]RPK40751.1 NB-ARC domain protein [Streptomyces sp. ADI93-02]